MSTATARPLDSWPTLAEMGITRFHEISHYRLVQDGAKHDVLKVYYQRQKGSLLPESRKYRFGRALNTVVADGGTARLEDVYEVSPQLLAAVAELDRLVARNAHEANAGSESKSTLLGELDAIERTLVQRLPEADAGTVAAKFDALRRQVEAL